MRTSFPWQFLRHESDTHNLTSNKNIKSIHVFSLRLQLVMLWPHPTSPPLLWVDSRLALQWVYFVYHVPFRVCRITTGTCSRRLSAWRPCDLDHAFIWVPGGSHAVIRGKLTWTNRFWHTGPHYRGKTPLIFWRWMVVITTLLITTLLLIFLLLFSRVDNFGFVHDSHSSQHNYINCVLHFQLCLPTHIFSASQATFSRYIYIICLPHDSQLIPLNQNSHS